MPINQTTFEDETGLKFITPFRFMTAQQRASRQPGVTDDLPAFQAALDYLKGIAVNNDGNTYFGAPFLYVPAGTYFWNGTLDVKDFTLEMRGEAQGKGGGAGTLIRLPANTVAFRIERANTTPAGTGPITRAADGSVFDGLSFEGGGSDYTKHGFIAHARFTMRNCRFGGFGGNGAEIVASSGTGGTSEGNANNFLVDNCTFASNHGHGIHVTGSDANAGTITNCDVSLNGLFGIADDSFLGNYVAGNHSSGNGLKGVGGNTSSSVVGYQGARYYVRPGQAAAAANTQPGTNAGVWGPLAGGVDPNINPTWSPGFAAIEGGAYRASNPNARTCFVGNYAEGSQAPCVLAQSTTAFGNFWDEVGVTGYDQPPCHVTSRYGSLSSAGGFYAQSGSIEVTYGRAGLFSDRRHSSAFPVGLQEAVLEGSDLGLLYGMSEQIYRIYGPRTGHPLGPLISRWQNGIAVGSDGTYVKLQATEGNPGNDGSPIGSRFFVRYVAPGQADQWVRTTGGWVPSGIVGLTQAPAQANSNAADVATLTADLNALLAKLRTARVLAG